VEVRLNQWWMGLHVYVVVVRPCRIDFWNFGPVTRDQTRSCVAVQTSSTNLAFDTLNL